MEYACKISKNSSIYQIFLKKKCFFQQKRGFFCYFIAFFVYISVFFSTFAAVMRNIPTVTRYLLIANLIVFLLTDILQRYGLDLNALCGLHYYSAQSFHWWQPVTYMFLHANFSHIFFLLRIAFRGLHPIHYTRSFPF